MKSSSRFALKRSLKTFSSRLDEHLQRTGTEESENITYPISHFSTLKGVEGILKSECLWLTNVNDLEDDTEIIWVLDLAMKTIREAAKSNDQPIRYFCEKFVSGVDTAMSDQFSFYSASFCQNAMSPHLWKHYGDDGRGAAISFTNEAFNKLNTEEDDLSDGIFLYPISYDVDEAEDNQSLAVDEAFRTLSRPWIKKALVGGYQDGIFLKELSVQLAIWLMFNATKYKLPEYMNEEEVRVLKVGEQSEFVQSVKNADGTGKRYVEYHFDQPLKQEGTIESITLGPNATEDDRQRIVSLLDELKFPRISVTQVKTEDLLAAQED